ncbi:hypothetical protein J6590_068556 [Homalodisca vitripennis]|nr:hypothetical protein J6590_068556 [Homalodisca vitripennis]
MHYVSPLQRGSPSVTPNTSPAASLPTVMSPTTPVLSPAPISSTHTRHPHIPLCSDTRLLQCTDQVFIVHKPPAFGLPLNTSHHSDRPSSDSVPFRATYRLGCAIQIAQTNTKSLKTPMQFKTVGSIDDSHELHFTGLVDPVTTASGIWKPQHPEPLPNTQLTLRDVTCGL